MSFSMKKPCDNCPFLREGGIRLTPDRVREIGGMMLSPDGGEFPCHKTVDNERRRPSDEEHCAGAMIFAEKNGNATQTLRIAERLRLYDAASLMANEEAVASVFCGLAEMLAVNRKTLGWPEVVGAK